MPDTYVRMPVDGVGKMIRARSRAQGADTVYEQYVALAGEPTWSIWTGAMSVTTTLKNQLAIWNNTGSAQVLKLKKLFIQNMTTAAPTVTANVTINVARITTLPTGTAVTPVLHDTTDTALSNATILGAAGGAITSTAGSTMFQFLTTNALPASTDVASRAMQVAAVNLIPESGELKEFELNPAEGYLIQQLAGTANGGNFGLYAVISRAV